MSEKNIDNKIQEIFIDFNNKDYEKVLIKCQNLINSNYKMPILYNLLGTVFTFKKKYEKSLEYYLQGIELDPNNEELHRNIGKNYLFLKNYFNAEIEFSKALEIKKQNPDALLNLGIIYIENKNEKKAIDFLYKSLELNPLFTETLYNLGICFKNLGDYLKAIEFYERAIMVNNNHVKSYNNLGVCYIILNEFEKAYNTLQQCLVKNPNYSHALNNLGSVYIALKKYSAAENCFEKAYSINKNLLNAGVKKIYLKRKNCDWSSEHEVSELMKNTIYSEESVSPWECLGMEDQPFNHLLRAKKFSQQFRLKSNNLTIYNNTKIRVGYFAVDFYQHPGMFNMLGIFKNHNKDKFHIIGFYYGNLKKDEMHYKIKSYFDEFYYVDGLNDKEIADLAKKTKIDIAINRSGHTDKARGNIFSYKPAPIQINYLGYAGTLGQEGIDYIIGDKFVIPDEYKKTYSEKIIYLSKSFYPKDESRVISEKFSNRIDLGIGENDFVFCSFNNSYKITKEEFEIWIRILKSVNNSHLVLLSNNEEMKKNLRSEAIKLNFDPDLIKFVDYIGFEDHMARHKIFDLFLDSFNYNAHTSAVDTLWAGLPILTKVGKSFSSRICGSILSSLNLNDLITYSKKDYEKKAIFFGNNKIKINEIKNKISKSKQNNTFFDIKQYTLKLEEAFECVHIARLNGKKPSSIEIK